MDFQSFLPLHLHYITTSLHHPYHYIYLNLLCIYLTLHLPYLASTLLLFSLLCFHLTYLPYLPTLPTYLTYLPYLPTLPTQSGIQIGHMHIFVKHNIRFSKPLILDTICRLLSLSIPNFITELDKLRSLLYIAKSTLALTGDFNNNSPNGHVEPQIIQSELLGYSFKYTIYRIGVCHRYVEHI